MKLHLPVGLRRALLAAFAALPSAAVAITFAATTAVAQSASTSENLTLVKGTHQITEAGDVSYGDITIQRGKPELGVTYTYQNEVMSYETLKDRLADFVLLDLGFLGKLKFGPTVKWGYLPQIIHFDHPERSLYDTMLYEKNCTTQTARDRLGAFLFQGEDVFKSVGNLSGGEQSRLRLCMLMDEKINLLILDEPTNHLDIASREWVEAAIEEFEGVLLFVSHDRYFIEKFAERIWLLEDGKIRDFKCGYSKYRSIIEHEAMQKIPETIVVRPKKEKPKGGTKDSEKLVRKLEREIDKQEKEIAQLDAAIEAAAADYQELTRLLAEKEAAEDILMQLMEQWEEAQACL